MAADETAAEEAARLAAEGLGPTDRIIEQLVERIGGRTGISALFGEPVERGETTVIPVGRVRWFFGAGAGRGPATNDEDQAGSGSGGGGGKVLP